MVVVALMKYENFSDSKLKILETLQVELPVELATFHNAVNMEYFGNPSHQSHWLDQSTSKRILWHELRDYLPDVKFQFSICDGINIFFSTNTLGLESIRADHLLSDKQLTEMFIASLKKIMDLFSVSDCVIFGHFIPTWKRLFQFEKYQSLLTSLQTENKQVFDLASIYDPIKLDNGCTGYFRITGKRL
jgi:monomeric isocitrate dehydrogenase